jgi:predicted HTH domain antitoxin
MLRFYLKIVYLYVMTTMMLNVPDALEKEHNETVRLIAAKLYEAEKISLGQAAVMCDMNKWEFGEVLSHYGVNYLDDSVKADIDNLKLS